MHPLVSNVVVQQVQPSSVFDILFRAVRAEFPGAIRLNTGDADAPAMRIDYAYELPDGKRTCESLEVDEFAAWGDDVRLGVTLPGNRGNREWFFRVDNPVDLDAKLASMLAIARLAFAHTCESYTEHTLDRLIERLQGTELQDCMDTLFAAQDRYGRGVRYACTGCTGEHPVTRCVKYQAGANHRGGAYEITRAFCAACAAFHEDMDSVTITVPLSGRNSVTAGVVHACYAMLLLGETLDGVSIGDGDTVGEPDNEEDDDDEEPHAVPMPDVESDDEAPGAAEAA